MLSSKWDVDLKRDRNQFYYKRMRVLFYFECSRGCTYRFIIPEFIKQSIRCITGVRPLMRSLSDADSESSISRLRSAFRCRLVRLRFLCASAMRMCCSRSISRRQRVNQDCETEPIHVHHQRNYTYIFLMSCLVLSLVDTTPHPHPKPSDLCSTLSEPCPPSSRLYLRSSKCRNEIAIMAIAQLLFGHHCCPLFHHVIQSSQGRGGGDGSAHSRSRPHSLSSRHPVDTAGSRVS